MAKEKDEYIRKKAAFLNLVLTDGLIIVKVLQSVDEFYEEGKAMHHCVYTNAYFGSHGRLIICCFCLAIQCAAVSGRNTSAGCAWAAWLFPLSPSACRAGTSIPLPPWRTGT